MYASRSDALRRHKISAPKVTAKSKIFVRLLLYLIGPAGAFFVFIIINKGFSLGTDSVFALLWTLIAYTLFEHTSRSVEFILDRQEFADAIGNISARIGDTAEQFTARVERLFKVSHLSEGDFIRRISDSVMKSSHVRNTYIGIKEDAGSSSPHHETILSSYEDILTRNSDATWDDIVGVADLFDGRYEALHDRLRGRTLGRHKLFVLTTSAPVLNFILLGPAGNAFTEVYFGWVKNAAGEMDRFHSNDLRIVAMFWNYFESLSKTKDRVYQLDLNYNEKRGALLHKSIFHRVCGTWLGLTDDSFKVASNYAVILIRYSDGWEISGDVFDRKSRKLKYRFESKMCFIVHNSIYYTYEDYDAFNRVVSSGVGTYFVSLDQDKLVGFYARSRPGVNRKDDHFAGMKAVKLERDRVNDKQYFSEMLGYLEGVSSDPLGPDQPEIG